MNIAYFINGIDQIGGAEIATTRLAEQMAKRGHKVICIGSQSISQWKIHRALIDYTKIITYIRLPVWQHSHKTFSWMLTIQALWSFPLFLRNIQIIHLRGLTPETITLALIAQHFGIKTICVPMASGDYGDVARFPPGNAYKFNAFDSISALTEPLRAELISWGFPTERISVIPNGVDTQIFKPAHQQPSKAHAIFVGQFRPEKRIDLLLKAWKIVQNEYPRSKLTLLGGGHYLPEYRHLANKLDVKATFIPNAEPSNVITHLHTANIFVQPGISEGMSNALLEAMAAGLAPVVSATPANHAVIRPGLNGLSYLPDSAEDLAEKLTDLIKNEPLRRRLAEAARQTIEQNFTLESVTDQYLLLYQRMLGENL